MWSSSIRPVAALPLASLLAAALACTPPGDSPAGDGESASRPNLVLFVVDTLRADRLGLYGHDRDTSPALERLAEDAWTFPHSLSASTCTQPSTASLLSGLSTFEHGVRAGLVLPAAAETVAEILQGQGYRTAAITDGGFVAPRWGFDQGFERYDATRGDSWQVKDVEPIVTAALDYLAGDPGEPFFLLVHTYETHQPYTDPEGFAEPFLEPDYDGPFTDKAVVHLDELGQLTDGDKRRMSDLYDGEVRRADHYLGRFLEALESRGLFDGLGLVVTSDHGEEFFEFGGVEHGFGRVYDPHVRVPMLVKPPGAPRGGGEERPCPASGLDVAPTLLDMAGVESPGGWLGRSLLECDAADRPVLAHGVSAFPKNHEIDNYRLDLGRRSVSFERRSGRLRAFALAEDGTLSRLLETPDAEALLAFEHLQAALAWGDEAPFAARLETGPGELVVPASSRLEATAVLDGFVRRQAERLEDGRLRLRLESEGPSYLLTDLRPGRGLHFEHRSEAGSREVLIRTRTRAGDPLRWRPLGGELPPAGVLFEGAPTLEAVTRQITPEEEAELRSLGYL